MEKFEIIIYGLMGIMAVLIMVAFGIGINSCITQSAQEHHCESIFENSEYEYESNSCCLEKYSDLKNNSEYELTKYCMPYEGGQKMRIKQ